MLPSRKRPRLRKIATLRGVGLADVLPGPLGPADPADPVRGVELDEFYRRSLADGLGYHQARRRGLLPAGLVEEIRALAQPPVPWDVELARWFAGRVRVRGRGGTVLQPGVRLLQQAPDFPEDGPILIITDAECDRVQVRREHAYLIPAGATLPFPPRGPVFRFS